MHKSSMIRFFQLTLALFFIPLLLCLTLSAEETKATAEAEKTLKNATPLPADGGAPGKAYMEYTKAIQAGNMDALKKLVSSDRAKQMEDPQFKQMFPMIQSMQAKDIKITGGSIAGKEAILNAQGTDSMGGGTSTGTIDMVQEGDQWKVKQDSWKSKMN
jgi:hypothetical protein